MTALRALLPALALGAAALPAAAGDLPAELAGLEAEAQRWFQEAGRPGVAPPERAAAREKALASASKVAEILARHEEANPRDRDRIASRRADAVAIAWWIGRESPGGPTGGFAPGPAGGSAPEGEGGSRNPFDGASADANAPADVRPTSIEQALQSADAWARARPHDLPGIQRKYLEAMTSFPDQAGQPTYLQAAERAGRAYEGLKEVFRRLRKSDPDAAGVSEIPEILRLLIVLGRDLGHQDSAIRERCARALGQLGSGEAVAPIGKAMRKEKVLQTLLAMGEALANIGGRRAIDALRGMRDEPELGPKAIDWLGKAARRNPVDGTLAVAAIGSYAVAKDAALASKAVDGLLALGPDGIPGLVEALSTNDLAARKKVIEALGNSKTPRVARPLSNFLLADDSPNAKASREAAAAAIKVLGMDAVPFLFPAVRNPRTQYWTGNLLREMTGQNFPSGRPGDWVDWWKKDHPDWKETGE